MPYKSCSSSPTQIPNRIALLAVTVVLVWIQLAPGSAFAQPERQVVVGFQIAPGSTLDQPRLTSLQVRSEVEAVLAQIVQQKFLFLEWVPRTGGDDLTAPYWSLLLDDGPSGACDPPAVRAHFTAGRGATVAWTYRALEFSEVCDIAAPEITSTELVTKASALASQVLGDAVAMSELESQFLSEIVVSKMLTSDPESQQLFLPLKGLKAKTESEIEVRFENRLDRRLVAHPANVQGDRTQLLIESFACAGITSGAPLANALPIAWHPRLSELLETCREPWVYMKRYKPNPLEVESGVVTSFDDGETL
ncbi:MAG: hypothetical protein K8J08_22585 [Thermoanaerobaculia bacterium]|nr:hypothetical protein [Thermoanaerobaculia bacterium]